MTIRRQYSLPNCTLILEGLGDGSETSLNQLDSRPLISILVNAECYFTGLETPLAGGRDFFESLVKAVSGYAQEFLSRVPHPATEDNQPALVHLHKLNDRNLHRLIVQNQAQTPTSSTPANVSPSTSTLANPAQQIIDLTTLQLFDLVEAIDQFLADTSTLPNLALDLTPVSRRYAMARAPLTKRAAPAAVGLTSLTLAAIALYIIPVPRVEKPKDLPSSSTKSSVSPKPSDTANPQASNSPKPPTPEASNLETLLTSAPEITNPTELKFLQRQIYTKIDKAWTKKQGLSESLIYRVGVGKDGAIVGYKPVNKMATDQLKETPLPELLYLPTNGSLTNKESIAQFKVVFNNRGFLQISPWNGYSGKPNFEPRITEKNQLKSLKKQLYTEIRKNWRGTPTYKGNLIYRVAIKKNGMIADYEAYNQAAFDYLKETPLPDLTKSVNPVGAIPKESLAQFKVIFKPSGILEINEFRE